MVIAYWQAYFDSIYPLASILISYIMLKNYQTRLLSQNKSLYLHELQNVNVSEIINFD